MKSTTPVAVTSRSFSRHPILRQELLMRYERVSFNDEGKSLAGSELIGFLRGHVMAITALERLDESVFAALPELRVISKYGVGLDTLDLEAMDRHSVLLGWTPGVNRRSVAELAVAFAISLLHLVPEATRHLQAGGWKQFIGRQLTGRTVGIVGCGHIGKEAAPLFRAFDCRVLANDLLTFPEFYQQHQIVPVALDDLLRQSDVVTLHVPLDASTRNLLSGERLQFMKPEAVLVNTARGGLVDESALKTMLAGQRLAGAAFDVFADEPPADRELIMLPNFLATPHIGGSTGEAILAMGRAAIAGLEKATEPRKVLERLGIR